MEKPHFPEFADEPEKQLGSSSRIERAITE